MDVVSRSRRLLLSLAIALVLFALAEVGLRVAGFSYPPAEFPIQVWNKSEDRLMSQEDYLYEPDVETLWRPRPGIRIQFGEMEAIGGEPELVNADGYRGALVDHDKKQGTLRVLTLGDSSTFGVGVRCEETYSARLEAMLRQRGIDAEVINGGVEGFTLRQGIERWRHFGRRYRPDVVIAAFGAVNDHWGALDLDDDDKIELNVRNSQGLRYVRRLIRRELRIAQWLAWVVDPDAFKEVWKAGETTRLAQMELAAGASQPEWEGTRRVGLTRFGELLQELEAEVEADGARLILVAMPRRREADNELPVLRLYTRAVIEAARDTESQVLYALARFREEERNAPERELFIHDFWHPNASGHQKLAEWLLPLVLDPARNRGNDPILPYR